MSAPQKVFRDNQAPQCEAKDLNAFVQEINNAISAIGFPLNDTDTTQLAEAIVNASLSGTMFDYSGSANSIILTTKTGKSAPKKYYDGMRAMFLASTPNTSAVTVNLSGLGVKNVKNMDGTDLDPGYISGFVELVFDETNNRFVLALQSGPGDYILPATASVWINFNSSTQSIGDSHNVSSLTDNGVGDTSVNFTSALTNNLYSVVANRNEDTSAGTRTSGFNLKLQGSVRILTKLNGALSDAPDVCVHIFGGK